MYAEIFASRIKKARENTGFTQREVAKETGIIQSTIAKYEIGALQPDLEKLGTLALVYQCVSVVTGICCFRLFSFNFSGQFNYTKSKEKCMNQILTFQV